MPIATLTRPRNIHVPAAAGPQPDPPPQAVCRELHDPAAGAPPEGLDVALYPSHMHIDLEAAARGQGQGGRLVRCLLNALAAAGSRGVYLQMHESNVRARAFYERLGFSKLDVGGGDGGSGGALFLGKRFPS